MTGACVAGGEEGLVVGRADVKGDLCFGTYEGAARVIRSGTRGNRLAGAG